MELKLKKWSPKITDLKTAIKKACDFLGGDWNPYYNYCSLSGIQISEIQGELVIGNPDEGISIFTKIREKTYMEFKEKNGLKVVKFAGFESSVEIEKDDKLEIDVRNPGGVMWSKVSQ